MLFWDTVYTPCLKKACQYILCSVLVKYAPISIMAPCQHKAGAPTAPSCWTLATSHTMGRLFPPCCVCIVELSNTRRTESGSRFLQRGQRAHCHHAARNGSRENIWGNVSSKQYRGAEWRALKAGESSAERAGVLGGVSPPQPTRWLGERRELQQRGSGAKPRSETHYGIFWRS